MKLKLSRSKEHLDLVIKETRSFTEQKTETVTFELEVENGYPRAHTNIPPMPARIGVLAADYFTCLRACLDYLTWQLAATPTKQTSFPILKKRPPEGFSRKAKNSLATVPKKVVSVIESLQPYRRGDSAEDHPLFLINEFANISKHRFIPASGASRKMNLLVPDGTTFERLSDNDMVIHYPEGRLDDVKIDPQARLHVVFGEPTGVQAELPDLTMMYEFVRDDVLPQFAGLFPQPDSVPINPLKVSLS